MIFLRNRVCKICLELDFVNFFVKNILVSWIVFDKTILDPYLHYQVTSRQVFFLTARQLCMMTLLPLVYCVVLALHIKSFLVFLQSSNFFSSIIISKLFELETLTNFFCSRMPSEGSPTKMLHYPINAAPFVWAFKNFESEVLKHSRPIPLKQQFSTLPQKFFSCFSTKIGVCIKAI